MSPRTTEQKLESARRRLEKSEAAWERSAPPCMGDPGSLSGIKGYNDSRDKVSRNITRTVNAAREGVAASEEVARLEQRLNRETRDSEIRANATMTVALEDIQPGDAIRYENRNSPRNVGRVIRVNARTFTIDAPAGFDKPKVDKSKVIASAREKS